MEDSMVRVVYRGFCVVARRTPLGYLDTRVMARGVPCATLAPGRDREERACLTPYRDASVAAHSAVR
jgi:hypothetical protein